MADLSVSLKTFSPRVTNPSPPGEQSTTPRSYFASLSGPTSPFPLSPLTPSRTRAGNSTAGSLKSLEQRISSKKAVSYAYVWPTQQRPTIQHDDFTDLEIPTVDLACLDTGHQIARKQVVSQVRAACREWGFFHVVNHGIPLELLDRVQKQAKLLFSLPKEEKMKVQRESGSITGYGHAAVKPTDSQPWSEGFYLANDSTVEKFSQTLWPHGDNKDFVESYRQYDEKVKNLAQKLMDIIIEGLEVNAAHFEKYLNNSNGLLRWNHYPPCPQPHKALGMSAHTDFNLLTLLHQGDIGGLQVEKDGKWIAVKPRRDALAINIGDSLQVLTNALYKSVPHRAVVNRSQARISLAYFFAPPAGVEFVPSPDLVANNDEKLYRTFTMEEYLSVKRVQLLNTLEHFSVRPLLQYLAIPFTPSTPEPRYA